MRKLLAGLLLLALGAGAQGDDLAIDKSRARDLEKWKPAIQNYSQRHYGEYTWKLEPTCIILHYTAGTEFPWNLVESTEFKGETPGLATHYVVDGTKVWELLPSNVRCRGAFGINHRGISIEMVAADAQDLAGRTQTLATTAKLCRMLMARHQLETGDIYSHQQVANMDPEIVPGVMDLLHPEPYDKIDPGEENMKTVLEMLSPR